MSGYEDLRDRRNRRGPSRPSNDLVRREGPGALARRGPGLEADPYDPMHMERERPRVPRLGKFEGFEHPQPWLEDYIRRTQRRPVVDGHICDYNRETGEPCYFPHDEDADPEMEALRDHDGFEFIMGHEYYRRGAGFETEEEETAFWAAEHAREDAEELENERRYGNDPMRPHRRRLFGGPLPGSRAEREIAEMDARVARDRREHPAYDAYLQRVGFDRRRERRDAPDRYR